jgi:aspartate 1-decarboxylase
MALLEMLKSKLHHARVTDGDKEYPGSIGISRELQQAVGLLQYERVLVANVENGERFETYVIDLEGPGQIVLNGAAAHLGKPGDRLIIMSFILLGSAEATLHKPRVATLDENNAVIPETH